MEQLSRIHTTLAQIKVLKEVTYVAQLTLRMLVQENLRDKKSNEIVLSAIVAAEERIRFHAAEEVRLLSKLHSDLQAVLALKSNVQDKDVKLACIIDRFISVIPREFLDPAVDVHAYATEIHNYGASPANQSTEIETQCESISDYLIAYDEIVFFETIGKGSFGKVYRADWHGPVAVKKMSYAADQPLANDASTKMASIHTPTITNTTAAARQNKNVATYLMNEIKSLLRCRHKNILLFLGVSLSKTDLCLVTEYCFEGSLEHLLLKSASKLTSVSRYFPLGFERTLTLTAGIADGMAYLAALGIVHRDLKSPNILLKDGTPKIADFGLAIPLQATQDQQPLKTVGSVHWMPPEVILLSSHESYSEKSDVYSFGIVLYELVTSKPPYYDLKNEQIIYMRGSGILPIKTDKLARAISKEHPLPEISFQTTKKKKLQSIQDYLDIITHCLMDAAEHRPAFKSLIATLHHTFSAVFNQHPPSSGDAGHQPTSQTKDHYYIP